MFFSVCTVTPYDIVPLYFQFIDFQIQYHEFEMFSEVRSFLVTHPTWCADMCIALHFLMQKFRKHLSHDLRCDRSHATVHRQLCAESAATVLELAVPAQRFAPSRASLSKTRACIGNSALRLRLHFSSSPCRRNDLNLLARH